MAAYILVSSATITVFLITAMNGEHLGAGIILGALYSVVYLLMIITTAIVTKSDPTDPATILEHAYRASLVAKDGSP